MAFWNRWLPLFTAAALISQPCLAANDFSDWQHHERRIGAFAGAVVNMELGRGRRTIPTARLQLGLSHRYQATGSALPSRVVRSPGLELGFAQRRPILFVAGQSTASLERRVGLNGSTNRILLIAGGIALAGFAVWALTSGTECGIPEGCEPGAGITPLP